MDVAENKLSIETSVFIYMFRVTHGFLKTSLGVPREVAE
jgi:hypothetical protein